MTRHYYNTTEIRGDDLKDSIATAAQQEVDVNTVMSAEPLGMTPWQVHDHFPATPITSIRRAMTNLTDRGILIKTTDQRPGPYLKPSYVWLHHRYVPVPLEDPMKVSIHFNLSNPTEDQLFRDFIMDTDRRKLVQSPTPPEVAPPVAAIAPVAAVVPAPQGAVPQQPLPQQPAAVDPMAAQLQAMQQAPPQPQQPATQYPNAMAASMQQPLPAAAPIGNPIPGSTSHPTMNQPAQGPNAMAQAAPSATPVSDLRKELQKSFALARMSDEAESMKLSAELRERFGLDTDNWTEEQYKEAITRIQVLIKM